MRAGLLACAAIAFGVVACSKTTAPRGSADTGLAKPTAQSVDLASFPGVSPRALPPPSERPKVPGFDGATAWLNVERPLTGADLAGKVVVVDFWTSCCINCLHTLPTLARLEAKFAKEAVVVVGVHTPKFEAEAERERLRSNVAEFGIAHPVAVDGSQAIWNRWKVQSWPTLFVLDTEGRVVWTDGGEPNPEELEGVVLGALVDGAKTGSLVRDPVRAMKPEKRADTPLAFPTKIVPREGGFVVADSGHHRIVFVDAKGEVSAVAGSGLRGRIDGAFADASFASPNGLAVAGDVVYVADTENHTIRVLDPKAKSVATVAGTGALGSGRLGPGTTPALETGLRSPWDLAWVPGKVGGKDSSKDGTLYVALAGSHQIGAFDPMTRTMRLFAGDGREKRVDGPADRASFAQPSGLARDGSTLYVADSETSSVRAITLPSTANGVGDVKTVVGLDLFVFGDKDGEGDAVRLQHPLGVATGEGGLFVADTYNSKIKRLDPKTRRATTIAGDADRKTLFEPQGFFVDGTGDKATFVVADTHHHRIVRMPVKGGAPAVVEVRGLTPPVGGVAVAAPKEDTSNAEVVHIEEVPIRKDAPSKVHVVWKVPAGTSVNDDAPFKVRWTTSEGLERAPDDMKDKGATVQTGFDVAVSPLKGVHEATLAGVVDLVVCDSKNHSVCVPVKRRVEMTLVGMPNGGDPKVTVPLPEAKPPK
ncbi:MAG: thioredoxin-like domain-containing protein [Polyangiaceae bacterium]